MHTNKIIIGIIQYNHSIEYWNVIVKSNISWEDPPISASFSNRNPPSKKSHLHLSARQMILQHTGLLFANDFIMNHKKVAINALEIEFDSESESSETNHKSHQRSTLKIHLMVSKWKIFMIHFFKCFEQMHWRGWIHLYLNVYCLKIGPKVQLTCLLCFQV